MAMQIAQTEYGRVRGARSGDPAITAFRGIPYAAPPIGALRWRAPQPPARWEGIRDATSFAPIAAQTEETHPFFSNEFYRVRPEMQEDCLYLNIWTPAESPEERLPVMLFIHGGGFQSGYGHEITMDGEGFARKGVLLVTIEYRLGCLGYLVHESLCKESPHGVSGNYGLLDQIEALQWVRKNIAAFGGDAENITIFGQSAGAMSVQNLMTAPQANRLFHKAILQSAGGYGSAALDAIPTLPMQEAARMGALFWKRLGVTDADQARKIPAEILIEQTRAFYENEASGFCFAPVVDGWLQPLHIYDAVRQNAIPDIPCILGFCTNENGPNTLLPRVSAQEYAAGIRASFGTDATAFLKLIDFDAAPETAIDQGGWNDSLQLGSIAWCEFMSNTRRKSPSYLYSFARQLPGDAIGAFHSSDLWYVFQTLHRCWRPMIGEDYVLADRMSRFWTNFAKKGDPNGEGLPRWTVYGPGRRQAMKLDCQCGMTAQFASHRAWFIVDKILREGKELRV